jgi:hypothetical protein
MKKLITLVAAAMFSMSAAAYACDGMKKEAKVEKAEKVAKKETVKKEKKPNS